MATKLLYDISQDSFIIASGISPRSKALKMAKQIATDSWKPVRVYPYSAYSHLRMGKGVEIKPGPRPKPAISNPRLRFKIGDSVSVPWFGKRKHGRVVQIKVGGRMVIDDHYSGLHDVPTKFARRLKGRKNPGPSVIPTKWIPATVSRKGRQIQIRMGG